MRTYKIKAGERYSTPRCTNARTRTKSTSHTNHANAHKQLLAHTLSCDLDPSMNTHKHTHTDTNILATCSQHARTAHDVLSNTAQSNVNTQRRTTLHTTRAAATPAPAPAHQQTACMTARYSPTARTFHSHPCACGRHRRGAWRSVRQQSQHRHPRTQRRRTRAHTRMRAPSCHLSRWQISPLVLGTAGGGAAGTGARPGAGAHTNKCELRAPVIT